MKNTFHILLTILLFTGAISFYSCSSHKEEEGIPALAARATPVGTESETKQITTTYNDAKAALEKNPADLQQYITLASAFIAEGRITGNSGYYNEAALKMLNTVMNSNTPNKDIMFQAYSLRSAVLLNLHQFRDALSDAAKGLAINNFSSGIYGSLIDAEVELGNYKQAVDYCDKMLAIRPDLRSYSRASYLRQIHGQSKEAIQAMSMAVEAGVPGEESTEWARTTLGDLYLTYGNVDSASIMYRTSLVYRPGYPYALIGMAKVEKARKNFDGAIAQTKLAIQTLSDGAFVALLADLYELKGDKGKAKEIRAELVSLLNDNEKEQDKNALAKHNANRELAAAYMNAGMYEKALTYARADLILRPDNIDANELAAWIYYLQGDYAIARVHADKMLATHTTNPTTIYKAGVIYSKTGELKKGNEYMEQAVAMNPFIDQRLTEQNKPVTAITK
jgi:tetratricopeptide (TPR) repeat protein